jgi:hypothetical protein
VYTYGETWGFLDWTCFLLPFLLPGALLIPYGRRKIREIASASDGRQRSFRVLGYVTAGVLACLCGAILVAAFFSKPYFVAGVMARSARCQENLRHLSSAVLFYTDDWDETLPPAARWRDLSARYLPEKVADQRLSCPSTHALFSYAFNRDLDQLRRARVDPDTVMLFESNSAVPNAVGDRSSVANPWRHTGTTNYALAYGQVKRATKFTNPKLRWLPSAELSLPQSGPEHEP